VLTKLPTIEITANTAPVPADHLPRMDGSSSKRQKAAGGADMEEFIAEMHRRAVAPTEPVDVVEELRMTVAQQQAQLRILSESLHALQQEMREGQQETNRILARLIGHSQGGL